MKLLLPIVWTLLGSAALPARAAPYTFLQGYTVLDEANAPGIGTDAAATTGLRFGGFGADVTNGAIYLTRETVTLEDGRTNPSPGLVAALTVTNGYNGANYTDTGLLGPEPGSQVLNASYGPVVIDAAKNRLLVLATGTNDSDFRGVVYAAALGTLGGSPAGGDPSAARPALTNLFAVPSDLTNLTGSVRGGTPRGLAARTAAGVTTVYLALGNHAEAWSDDATNGAPQFPWRRLWATLRAPRQNSVASRLVGADQVLNGIDADDAGNCYFTVQFTDPPRLWRVPANAASLAPEPFNLDFDDRAVGGTNATANALVIPVIPRLPAPAMLFDGTNSFVNPQDVRFFRTDGRAGLFVSSLFWMNAPGTPYTPYRSVARLVLEPATATSGGYPFQPAAVVDAFGSGTTATNQDTILRTIRSSFINASFGLTQPMKYYLGERLWTQVNAATNPSVIYFQAYLTDTNKGQTLPTAAIGLASIPPLPPPPTLLSVSPTNGPTSGGTLVTLTGSNFAPGLTVLFGASNAVSVNFSNATLATAVTPPSTAGPVHVTAQNPDTQRGTLTNAFTFESSAEPFRITSLVWLDASSLRLTWEALAGRVYVVHWRDTLNPTDWSNLGTVTAVTATAAFTDTSLGGVPRRFYRVVRLP